MSNSVLLILQAKFVSKTWHFWNIEYLLKSKLSTIKIILAY